jgi:hypothetical protein
VSRSGYSNDLDQGALNIWRGAVESAIYGKRGQAFLVELVQALDALPAPRLIAKDLVSSEGEVCALGAVGKARGVDMTGVDTYDRHALSETFGIAGAMAAEIMYENDERTERNPDWTRRALTPEERFQRMREWALDHLLKKTLIGEPEPELETDECP